MISERKRRVALPIFSLDYCGRYHWKEGKLQGSGVISCSFINSNKTSKKQINKKIFRWFLGCYKFSEFFKAILGDFRWFWEHWPPCLTQVLQPCTKFLGLTVPYFFRLYWVKMTYQTKSISSKESLLFLITFTEELQYSVYVFFYLLDTLILHTRTIQPLISWT